MLALEERRCFLTTGLRNGFFAGGDIRLDERVDRVMLRYSTIVCVIYFVSVSVSVSVSVFFSIV